MVVSVGGCNRFVKEKEWRYRDQRGFFLVSPSEECISFWREKEKISRQGQGRILNWASDKSEFQDIHANMKPPN